MISVVIADTHLERFSYCLLLSSRPSLSLCMNTHPETPEELKRQNLREGALDDR
jgi:hypothetical protein